MNTQVKRHYGPVWMAANTGVAAAAAVRVARENGRGRSVALAQLLAHGSVPAMLARVMLTRSSSTSRNLPGYQAAGLAGTLLLAAQGRPARRQALQAAVLAVAGNAAYTAWYSRFDRPAAAGLAVGRRMPEVTFADERGRPVSTADLLGRPAVYMFLRGNWCPMCMAQAREMAARYRELEAAGVQVALVAAQDEEHTRDLAERLGVSFRYLHDPELRASRALGLLHAGGRPPGIPGYEPDSIFPTVVVTGAEGEILFCHQTDNYRVRPTPELIFEALSHSHGKPSAQPAAGSSPALSGT